MSDLDICRLSPQLVEPYRRFARGAFGDDSYQSRAAYLTWLYEDNPTPNVGLDDAVVAVSDGEVVGCFHKLQLPWVIGDARARVCSPHNLYVTPQFRPRGAGFALISETFAKESHLLLVGAGPAVQPIYERLGAKPVRTRWFRTVVNPFSAPVVMTLGATLPRVLDATFAATTKALGSKVTDTALTEVAAMLHLGARGRAHVDWTVDLLRWRFFSMRGPRHILVRSARGLAIVSLALHHAVYLARTVEWYAEDSRAAVALALRTRAVLTSLGVNVWLAVSCEPRDDAPWRLSGFWESKAPPAVFELNKPRTASLGDIAFHGAASDCGLEALPVA